MIELECPRCGQTLQIDETFAGQAGKCKHCQGTIEVPEAEGDADQYSIDAWRKSWQTFLTDLQVRSIERKIGESVAKGKAIPDLWENLEEVAQLNRAKTMLLRAYKHELVGEGVKDEALVSEVEAKHAELLSDLRKEIAEIEQQLAINENEFAKAKQDGKAYKIWISIGDDLHSDGDVANEAQGWIPIDEPFSSGHLTAPSHAGCRCSVTYRKTVPDEMSIARAAERAEATAHRRKQLERAAAKEKSG